MIQSKDALQLCAADRGNTHVTVAALKRLLRIKKAPTSTVVNEIEPGVF
jgi:hypothetical protein